jgi:hypothetical protein
VSRKETKLIQLHYMKLPGKPETDQKRRTYHLTSSLTIHILAVTPIHLLYTFVTIVTIPLVREPELTTPTILTETGRDTRIGMSGKSPMTLPIDIVLTCAIFSFGSPAAGHNGSDFAVAVWAFCPVEVVLGASSGMGGGLWGGCGSGRRVSWGIGHGA